MSVSEILGGCERKVGAPSFSFQECADTLLSASCWNAFFHSSLTMITSPLFSVILFHSYLKIPMALFYATLLKCQLLCETVVGVYEQP